MSTMSKPNGSMCASGFSVSRPARSAVSSPKRLATNAWPNSWQVSENTNAPMSSANSTAWPVNTNVIGDDTPCQAAYWRAAPWARPERLAMLPAGLRSRLIT